MRTWGDGGFEPPDAGAVSVITETSFPEKSCSSSGTFTSSASPALPCTREESTLEGRSGVYGVCGDADDDDEHEDALDGREDSNARCVTL